jgi:hypothetical protein
MAEREVMLGLATEIISAHVRNNAVQTNQLPGLIQQVFNALSMVEQKSAAPPRPEPAVPVRKSVRPNHIICLDCGKQFSMITTSADGSSTDAGGLSTALAVIAIVLPFSCTCLRADSIRAGEEVRIRS